MRLEVLQGLKRASQRKKWARTSTPATDLPASIGGDANLLAILPLTMSGGNIYPPKEVSMGAMDVVGPPEETLTEMVDAISPPEETPMEVMELLVH